MAKSPASRLPAIMSESATILIADWLAKLNASPDSRLGAPELESQCESIVKRLAQACRDGNVTDTDAPSFAPLREILADLSRTRALAGFSPTETAKFILSLKQPLFARLGAALAAEPERLTAETLTGSELIDALGLFMMEAFQRAREEVIIRQQTEIAELSTPVKTVAAARLMGADCIISGIRPQIAQTMVHLGVELNVISKANLSDAFALALRRLGKVVVNQRRAVSTEPG
jgi:rsbT co-antagonist protein RsbR